MFLAQSRLFMSVCQSPVGFILWLGWRYVLPIKGNHYTRRRHNPQYFLDGSGQHLIRFDAKMFAGSLLNIGSLACRREHVNGIQRIHSFLHYSVRCSRGVASSSTSVVEHNKQKTMEDLDGPSLATTLYWLIGKGYLSLSHQMQVSALRLKRLP